MNLHEDMDVFQEFITATASHFNIPEVYVEKDYWVTQLLLNLKNSAFSDRLVFKGGTSLSKAHKLIKRFSEDVDLAFIVGDLNSNQLKVQIKAAEKALTVGFDVIEGHINTSKGGKFRKTVYEYPKQLDGDFGQASPELLLEINAFAEPEPATPILLNSLIAEFLSASEQATFVEQFGLESIEIAVLNVERTLCEKIMGLVKASRAADSDNQLKAKIRHVYDICMVLRLAEYQDFINSDDFSIMLSAVKICDSRFPGSEVWLASPLNDVDIFKNIDTAWPALSAEFTGPFSEMVYDDKLPNEVEIVATFSLIQKNLARFEARAAGINDEVNATG